MSTQDDLPDCPLQLHPSLAPPSTPCVSGRSNGRTGALEFVAVDPDLLDARSGQTSTPTPRVVVSQARPAVTRR